MTHTNPYRGCLFLRVRPFDFERNTERNTTIGETAISGPRAHFRFRNLLVLRECVGMTPTHRRWLPFFGNPSVHSRKVIQKVSGKFRDAQETWPAHRRFGDRNTQLIRSWLQESASEERPSQ